MTTISGVKGVQTSEFLRYFRALAEPPWLILKTRIPTSYTYTTSATVFFVSFHARCLRGDGKNKTAIEKAAFTLDARYRRYTYAGLADCQECLFDIQISDVCSSRT